MIRAELRQQDGQYTLKASGHADFQPYGSDIVCSAFTILLYSLAQSIETMETRGELREAPALQLDPGDAVLQFFPHIGARLTAYRQLETVAGGIRLLAQSYPEHISFDDTVTQ